MLTFLSQAIRDLGAPNIQRKERRPLRRPNDSLEIQGLPYIYTKVNPQGSKGLKERKPNQI